MLHNPESFGSTIVRAQPLLILYSASVSVFVCTDACQTLFAIDANRAAIRTDEPHTTLSRTPTDRRDNAKKCTLHGRNFTN